MSFLIDAQDFSKYVFDFGPRYHEFNAEDWIKEPWNAFSSLSFFIPVIYY